MTETIKTYEGGDVGVSQCLVTLEGFIGDMDSAELADDSTIDTSNPTTAINGLVWSLERREAEIERLRAALKAAIRAAELALFVIRKQDVMPNSSWQSGFDNDLATAKAALGDGEEVR